MRRRVCLYCRINMHHRCLFDAPEVPQLAVDGCVCADRGHPDQPRQAPNPERVTVLVMDGPAAGALEVDAPRHHRTREPLAGGPPWVDVDGLRYHKLTWKYVLGEPHRYLLTGPIPADPG